MRWGRWATAALLATLATPATSPAAADTFGGYLCSRDCTGHAAGYEWARDRDVTDIAECDESQSWSFREGCGVYLDDPDRDPWTDDDGRPIRRRH